MSGMPVVSIYSDGACQGNPGPGGWAAILISKGHIKEISGAEPQTTNNRMEITAALESLKALNKPSVVHFYTDSSYLVNAATAWLQGWKARGWKRKDGEREQQPAEEADCRDGKENAEKDHGGASERKILTGAPSTTTTARGGT